MFDLNGVNGTTVSCGRMPEISYVFCGDRIFLFSLRLDVGLAESLDELPRMDSVLPIEARHAVALCGATASPALLEEYLGAVASPFPVVMGRITDHDVVPAHGAAGAGRLMRDTLKLSTDTSAVAWIALLNSLHLGTMEVSHKPVAAGSTATWGGLLTAF